jgi:hypothetical protein
MLTLIRFFKSWLDIGKVEAETNPKPPKLEPHQNLYPGSEPHKIESTPATLIKTIILIISLIFHFSQENCGGVGWVVMT